MFLGFSGLNADSDKLPFFKMYTEKIPKAKHILFYVHKRLILFFIKKSCGTFTEIRNELRGFYNRNISHKKKVMRLDHFGCKKAENPECFILPSFVYSLMQIN